MGHPESSQRAGGSVAGPDTARRPTSAHATSVRPASDPATPAPDVLAALAQCAAAPRPHATLTFPTLTFPGGALTGSELSVAAARVAASVAPGSRVAVWATPTLDTAVTILGALAGGAVVVPLNPAVGRVELSHILGECRPRALLTSADADADTPAAVVALPRLSVDWRAGGEGEGDAGHAAGVLRDRAERAEDAALIIYTSGTTGPPKGAVLSHRALAACVHGLAHVWRWTADDVLVHALPLFHVHGLVLGLIGPLLVGCPLVHTGSFDPASLADALQRGGTMLFGVPTMYHRLGLEAERNADVAVALRQARLLISGSAPLASADRARIERLTDRTVIERYGLTETLIVCAMPPEAARVGVGVPIPGIEMRLVDDAGTPIEAGPSETGADDVMGDVEIRGATLFSGYLDRPDATSAAFRDGWFKTGDTARRDADGLYTIVGRSSLDVIKTGGFKVGAGEVEDALRTHPEIADVAVTGEPDADLGQRIVAWIVPHAGCAPALDAVAAHVAATLAPHKRPRALRLLDALPRNAMGKVEKRRLTTATLMMHDDRSALDTPDTAAADGDALMPPRHRPSRSQRWLRVTRRRFLKRAAGLTAALLGLPRTAFARGSAIWMWSGAVTTNSIVVKAKVTSTSKAVRLLVSTNGDLSNPTMFPKEGAVTPSEHLLTSFKAEGLQPDTPYYYALEVDGERGSSAGRFRTFADGPMSFKMVFASCATTGSISRVFTTIRRLEPLFLLHMGDLHYQNIGTNTPSRFRRAYDYVLDSSTQSALYRQTPIVYVFDDHDFGKDDANSTAPSKVAAQEVYREAVPHYPLDLGDAPRGRINQAFTVGRIRFIVTDTRSERVPWTAPNDANKTMLGKDQLNWLKRELEDARDRYTVIVWVSTVPWITKVDTTTDEGWQPYDRERREIADHIKRLGLVNRLVMLSGDAHMVAIDDGTNSNYASDARPDEPSFPVIQAAPFDRYPRKKGGPYSHGMSLNYSQFGLMQVKDDGKVLDMRLSGHKRDGDEIPKMVLERKWETR